MIDKDDLIDALALKPFGQKGGLETGKHAPIVVNPINGEF